MPKRVTASTLLRTIGQLGLLILVVVALRGSLPGSAARQHSTGSTTGPIVVLAVAIAAAGLAFFAALLHRSAARATHSAVPRPDMQIPWRALTWLALAAALAVVLFALLSPRQQSSETPAPSARQPATATSTAGPVPDEAPPDSPPPGATAHLWPAMIVALPVLVALLGAGALVYRRSTPETSGASSAVPRQPEADSLARAAELGLAAVTEPSRDPRAAIIDCYVAMERGLAEAPEAVPQASDTASEVLARAVDHGVLHGHSAAALVELFTEARFSPHRMTEKQRESAAAMLRGVLDDLRGSACAPQR